MQHYHHQGGHNQCLSPITGSGGTTTITAINVHDSFHQNGHDHGQFGHNGHLDANGDDQSTGANTGSIEDDDDDVDGEADEGEDVDDDDEDDDDEPLGHLHSCCGSDAEHRLLHQKVVRKLDAYASENNTPGHQHDRGSTKDDLMVVVGSINKLNDVQAFVEHEQKRRECRQIHLLQWKMFCSKIGGQLNSLTMGGLNALDQMIIDILMKNCTVLEELRINNELDVLFYLTIIKPNIKRIYINVEHGIGEFILGLSSMDSTLIFVPFRFGVCYLAGLSELCRESHQFG